MVFDPTKTYHGTEMTRSVQQQPFYKTIYRRTSGPIRLAFTILMVLFSYPFRLCSSSPMLMCLFLISIPDIPILGLCNRPFERRFPTRSVHFVCFHASQICYSDNSGLHFLLSCCVMGRPAGKNRRVKSSPT